MSEVQNNLGEKFKETITEAMKTGDFHALSLIHISEPTRHSLISYAVFCLKKKKIYRI